MTRHSLLAAVAAPFVVAGCAALPPGGKVQYQRVDKDSSSVCTSHNCKVDVIVTGDCKAEARPYFLIMVAKAPVTVTWEVSRNATFVREGVFFKEVEGRKVFRRSERAGDEKQVVFSNDMRDGIFHYGIRVAVNGRECPVLDPTGVNDMVTGGGPDGGP